MRKKVIFLLKIVILAFILFISFSIAAMLVGTAEVEQTGETIDIIIFTLIMCILDAAVLSYLIVRSRWFGWRLILTIFFVFYGVKTFLTQIETIVFLKHLTNIVSAEMIPKLFMQGFITAAIFSPLAVLIHGRMRERECEEIQVFNQRPVMPLKEWIWKLLLIAVVYVVIYISFGMFVFIPLAGKAFQEYYGDLQMPEWILLFQMARAMIWVVLALPVIRMIRGRWWEGGLAVALMFSVLMSANLLVPTEVMPETIRKAHFVEVFSSNFLFGWIVFWLLHRSHKSLHELFQWPNG